MRDPSRNTESHHRIDPNAAKYILRPKRGWERGGSEQTLRTRRSLCNGYSLEEEEDAHVGRSRPNLAFHRFVYLFINSYIYTARVVEYAEIEPRRKNRDTHLGWSFAWLGSARGTQPCCPGVVVVVVGLEWASHSEPNSPKTQNILVFCAPWTLPHPTRSSWSMLNLSHI